MEQSTEKKEPIFKDLNVDEGHPEITEIESLCVDCERTVRRHRPMKSKTKPHRLPPHILGTQNTTAPRGSSGLQKIFSSLANYSGHKSSTSLQS